MYGDYRIDNKERESREISGSNTAVSMTVRHEKRAYHSSQGRCAWLRPNRNNKAVAVSCMLNNEKKKKKKTKEKNKKKKK